MRSSIRLSVSAALLEVVELRPDLLALFGGQAHRADDRCGIVTQESLWEPLGKCHCLITLPLHCLEVAGRSIELSLCRLERAVEIDSVVRNESPGAEALQPPAAGDEGRTLATTKTASMTKARRTNPSVM